MCSNFTFIQFKTHYTHSCNGSLAHIIGELLHQSNFHVLQINFPILHVFGKTNNNGLP